LEHLVLLERSEQLAQSVVLAPRASLASMPMPLGLRHSPHRASLVFMASAKQALQTLHQATL